MANESLRFDLAMILQEMDEVGARDGPCVLCHRRTRGTGIWVPAKGHPMHEKPTATTTRYFIYAICPECGRRNKETGAIEAAVEGRHREGD